MTDTVNMRKLMESVNPAKEMDVADIPVDNMGAMDNSGYMDEYAPDMGNEEAVSTEIIDALEGEFKRLTTEYLQTGGELDEAGLTDIREKIGKHMASILDVLHSGWMDNMMDQDGGGSDGDSSDDTPAFMQSDDDSDDTSDDTEETDDEAEETDDSEDDSEEKDDSDDEKEYNFGEAHQNESAAKWMRRLQDKILKG